MKMSVFIILSIFNAYKYVFLEKNIFIKKMIFIYFNRGIEDIQLHRIAILNKNKVQNFKFFYIINQIMYTSNLFNL